MFDLVEGMRQWVSSSNVWTCGADQKQGNFMLSLELRSLRNSDSTVIGASQPVRNLKLDIYMILTQAIEPTTPSSYLIIHPLCASPSSYIPHPTLRPPMAVPLALPIQVIGLQQETQPLPLQSRKRQRCRPPHQEPHAGSHPASKQRRRRNSWICVR